MGGLRPIPPSPCERINDTGCYVSVCGVHGPFNERPVNAVERLEDKRMTGIMSAVSVMSAAALLLPGAARADDCLTDWGMAGQIVRREKLITVQEVSRSLAADGIGEVVKTTLCRSPDGYFYRIVIRGPSSQLRTTIITARVR